MEGTASYTISAHLQGVTEGDAASELMMGFLAWYRDADNFVIAYVQYSPDDRAHEAREMQVTGTFGGVDIGWNDMYTDGNGIHPADGFDFTVAVSIGEDSASFTCTMSGGTYTNTQTATVSGISQVPTHLGFYCQSEPTTYSDISIA